MPARKKFINFAKKHMKDRFAVGADIGGSHISSAVVDLSTGALVTAPVVTPVDNKASASEILNGWSSNIRETLSGCDFPVKNIGFAFPGPFDYDRGISLIAGVSKFDNIFGLDVGESLKAMLGTDAVDMEFRYVNDASAFALGECLGGAAKEDDRVIALTLGTGVGSGFVASHKLVDRSEDVPANGWVYCLPFEDSIVDDAFSTRWVIKRYKELTGREVSGAKEVADMYDKELQAKQLFEEYGERMAAFVSPLLEKFRSRTLVLGGNISRAYPLFAASLEAGFRQRGMDVNVKSSILLDKAALIGAASLFI